LVERKSGTLHLSTIGINGYLEYKIYYSSFDSERPENFIKKTIPEDKYFLGAAFVLQVLQRRLGGKALSLREDQRNPTLGTLGHDPGSD
jgi:hypothetical protein